MNANFLLLFFIGTFANNLAASHVKDWADLFPKDKIRKVFTLDGKKALLLVEKRRIDKSKPKEKWLFVYDFLNENVLPVQFSLQDSTNNSLSQFSLIDIAQKKENYFILANQKIWDCALKTDNPNYNLELREVFYDLEDLEGYRNSTLEREWKSAIEIMVATEGIHIRFSAHKRAATLITWQKEVESPLDLPNFQFNFPIFPLTYTSSASVN